MLLHCGPSSPLRPLHLSRLARVHPSDRRDHVPHQDHSPEGREAPSHATRRPQAVALLTVILVGSGLERREDGRSCAGALGGRNGGRPGTGGARGHARAAARRAPQVLRRNCQSGYGESPAGACARPPNDARRFARRTRCLARDPRASRRPARSARGQARSAARQVSGRTG